MQGAETPDIDEQNQVRNQLAFFVWQILDFLILLYMTNTLVQVLMMLLKVSCEVRRTTIFDA